MKGIAFAATVIMCLTAFSITSPAQDGRQSPKASATQPDVKGPGWSLPFASQAMTDNLGAQKPPWAGGGATGNRAKFDHISDDTPPNQGIAPQKSQK